MEDQQGRRQGNDPGPDHTTDVYPSEGYFFTTKVVLQGLVADDYECWFVMGFVCLVKSRSFFGWFLSLAYDKVPLKGTSETRFSLPLNLNQ